MAEWIKCKISDIGTVVGGATPSTKKPENYENGTIAWITPKDLSTFSGRYIQHGKRNITETGLNSCSTRLLPKNTVLFSSRAPIGYVAIAANDVCTNQGFKSVVPNENTDPVFLYYLLKYNKDKIESMGSGTTFKEVSGNIMKNIIVSIPIDKKIQEKIASVLSSIDDKIEENEKINNKLNLQSGLCFPEHSQRGVNVTQQVTQNVQNDIKMSFKQVISQIQKMPQNKISDEDKDILCGKLIAIEMSNNKQSRWEKIQDTLKWIAEKGIEVCIATLPYIVKAIE